MRRRRLAALLPITLYACAQPTPAPHPPAPVRQPTPPIPVAVATPADWQDWPFTPGTWSYAQDQRGSLALFGTPGADARLLLRCDRAARTIYLSIPGNAAGTIVFTTTSTARALAAHPTGDVANPHVAVALVATDPLLDAMGFSRGRFVVAYAGATPLVIPAWAEVERVTQDCRG